MNNSKSVPEAIVDKIKKLLELTTSPNEHEAKLAMDQAKRLMAKYSVQFTDLSEDEIKDSITREYYWNDNAFSKQGVFEQIPEIINTIAPIFGVQCLIYTRAQRKGYHISKDRQFELIGFPANITVAKFALDSILAQGILEARAKYKQYRTVTFGMSFWSGFKIGLYEKFGTQSNHTEETGLAVYDKVRAFVKSLSTGTLNENTSFDGVAYTSGYNAGLEAELRKGLESSGSNGKLLSNENKIL